MNKDIKDTTIAIQGFGNVGFWAFKNLYEVGAKIIAVSDIHGGTFAPNGLDLNSLSKYYSQKKRLKGLMVHQ
ncbi:MAG: hypothetical protein QW372_00280 [Nitrososphaerales archaeon]